MIIVYKEVFNIICKLRKIDFRDTRQTEWFSYNTFI